MVKKTILNLTLFWIFSITVSAQISVNSMSKISTNVPGLTLQADAMFGGDIASIGDINGDGISDYAVGSHGFDSRKGGVFILFMNADGSVNHATVIADGLGGLPSGALGSSAYGSDNMFGSAVEGLGDLDGDGVNDIIVAASEGVETTEWYQIGIGSLFVLFLNNDGSVKNHTWIYSPNHNMNDSLPYTANINADIENVGDLDGDGVVDIAVSAIGYPHPTGGDSVNSGAVLLMFLNSDGSVKKTKVINDIADAHDDFFGCSIEKIGDVNNDGITDFAVGSYGYDGSSNLEGAVYILLMNSDTTVGSTVRIAENESGFNYSLDLMDVFGMSITAPGDINGDCIPDIIVAAPWEEDGTMNNAGSFFIICLNENATVKSFQRFSSSSQSISGAIEANDRFGSSICYLGDVDNSGFPKILVGAIFDDDQGGNAGALYSLSLQGVEMCGNNAVNDQSKDSEIVLSPSVTSDFITLMGLNQPPSRIDVYDVYGRLVDIDVKMSDNYTLDVRNYTKGMYVLNIVFTSGTNYSSKFIVK